VTGRGRSALTAALVAIALAALAPVGARAAGSAYIANAGGGGTVAQFDIGSTGALTAKTPATAIAGPTPSSVGITPAGDHVYVTNSTATPALEFVSQYGVASGGGLQPKTPPTVPAGGNAIAVTVTPDGRHVYVGSNLGAEGFKIFIYDVDPGGALVPKTPAFIAVGSGANGLAMSPNGRNLYATGTGGVAQFDINADGTLSPESPATVPAGSIPSEPVIAPDGSSLYVSNLNDSNVSQYDVGADGRLTAKNPLNVGVTGFPIDLAMSPDGHNVYVAASNGNVSQFSLGAGGQLVPKTPAFVVAGADANAVEVSPDSRSAYVTTGSSVAQYDVNADGTLTPKSPATVPVGASPNGIGLTPNQGPRAAFTTRTAPAGVPVAFNGSGSTDPDDAVGGYAWNFGDGATTSTAGATPTHSYAKPGRYAASLTVTDAIGCSTAFVSTGQVASCNGGPAAQATATVVVAGAALKKLRLRPSAFRPTRRGGSVARRRARRGTRVSYTLDAPAVVRFAVERARPGRRAGGKCRRPTRRNSGRRRCTRWVRQRGGFTRTSAGARKVSFRFTGRLRRKALPRGRYRLVATPVSGGVTGTVRRARFRIVR
jgi:6-phosphogluconolactonase (cycloisomerase 2 family)